jgi:hypothetical protein
MREEMGVLDAWWSKHLQEDPGDEGAVHQVVLLGFPFRCVYGVVGTTNGSYLDRNNVSYTNGVIKSDVRTGRLFGWLPIGIDPLRMAANIVV